MNRPPRIHIKHLRLDLRGLPADTARALPECLEAALGQAVQGHPLTPGSPRSDNSRALQLRLDPQQSPQAIAASIAESLVRSIQTAPPPSHATSGL